MNSIMYVCMHCSIDLQSTSYSKRTHSVIKVGTDGSIGGDFRPLLDTPQ